MAAVGLLSVGAVLFMNGTMGLDWVDRTSVAPPNAVVGLSQVLAPTFPSISAHGDLPRILAAAGLSLFGFTYLAVGWSLRGGLNGTGLGRFWLFGAVATVVNSILSLDAGDPVFGAMWLYWSVLWLLHYLLLGRKQAAVGRSAGAVATVQGRVTDALAAFLLDGSPRLHRGEHLCGDRARCAFRPAAPAQADASGRHGPQAGSNQPTPPPSGSTETRDGLCPRIYFR